MHCRCGAIQLCAGISIVPAGPEYASMGLLRKDRLVRVCHVSWLSLGSWARAAKLELQSARGGGGAFKKGDRVPQQVFSDMSLCGVQFCQWTVYPTTHGCSYRPRRPLPEKKLKKKRKNNRNPVHHVFF